MATLTAAPPTWDELAADDRFQRLTGGERLGVLNQWHADVKQHLGTDYDEAAAQSYLDQQRAKIAAEGQSPISTAARSFMTGAGDVFTGTVEGLGGLATDVAQAADQLTGIPGVGAAAVGAVPMAQGLQAAAPFAEAAQQEIERTYAPDARLNPWSAMLGGAAGQSVAMLPSAVAGPAGPLTLGGAMGYGQGREQAAALGVTDPLGRMALGAGFAGAEVLTGRMGGLGAGPMTQAFSDVVQRVGGNTLKTIGSEAIEEPITGFAQDALSFGAGQLVQDPNRPGFTTTGVELAPLSPLSPQAFDRRVQELAGGAVGGTVFAGAARLAGAGAPKKGSGPPPLPLPEGEAGATEEDFDAFDQTRAPSSLITAEPGSSASVIEGVGGSTPPAGTTQPKTLAELAASGAADKAFRKSVAREDRVRKQQELDQLEARVRAAFMNAVPPDEVTAMETRIKELRKELSEATATGGEAQGVAGSTPATGTTPAAVPSIDNIGTKFRGPEMARAVPVIPDNPLGYRDSLDFLNEMPIAIGRSGTGGELDWQETASVPKYYRPFIASEQGLPIDVVAQAAYEAQMIPQPTADALMERVQRDIGERRQYRVQGRQQQQQALTQEKQALAFDKSQQKVKAKPGAMELPVDLLAAGDELTIDGEPVTVRAVDADEDGYVTRVVLEDGKKFGVQAFNPQTREGVFVDEYQPRPQLAGEEGVFSRAQAGDASPGGLTEAEVKRWRKIEFLAGKYNLDLSAEDRPFDDWREVWLNLRNARGWLEEAARYRRGETKILPGAIERFAKQLSGYATNAISLAEKEVVTVLAKSGQQSKPKMGFRLLGKVTKTPWGSRYYHFDYKGQWWYVRVADHANTANRAGIDDNTQGRYYTTSGMSQPQRLNIVLDEPASSDAVALAYAKSGVEAALEQFGLTKDDADNYHQPVLRGKDGNVTFDDPEYLQEQLAESRDEKAQSTPLTGQAGESRLDMLGRGPSKTEQGNSPPSTAAVNPDFNPAALESPARGLGRGLAELMGKPATAPQGAGSQEQDLPTAPQAAPPQPPLPTSTPVPLSRTLLDQAEAASTAVPGWQRGDLDKLFTRARNLLAKDGNVEVRPTDAVTVPEGLAKIVAGEDAALVAGQWAQHRNDYVQGKTTEASPWTPDLTVPGKAAATIRDSRTVQTSPTARLQTAYRQLDRSGQGYVRIPDLARAAGLTPEETRGVLAELDDSGQAYLTPADEPRNIPEADRPFLVNGPSGKALFVTLVPEGTALASPSTRAVLKRNTAVNKAELTKLGLPTSTPKSVWGQKPVKEAMSRIAKDQRLPATVRRMAKLLQDADLTGLFLRVEADGRKKYTGLYQPLRNGQGELVINLRHLGVGNVDPALNMAETLVHEVLHHATYRALRGPKNDVQKSAIGNLEQLRRRVKAVLGSQQMAEFDYQTSNLDEFIAALFTQKPFQDALAGIPAEATPKTLLQQVRTLLDEAFRLLAEIVTGKKVPPGSVLDAAFQNALRLVEDGVRVAGNYQALPGGGMLSRTPSLHAVAPTPLQSVRAYHGTPHKVDKFTTAKIGTGEGAQAYGWGLYFAESKAVGEQYRDQLQTRGKNADAEVDGYQLWSPEGIEWFKLDQIHNEKLGKVAMSEWLETAPKEPKEVRLIKKLAPLQKKQLERIKYGRTKGAGAGGFNRDVNNIVHSIRLAEAELRDFQRSYQGNLYTVELLPDESEFLDWDRPVSEQSEKVRAALVAAYPEIKLRGAGLNDIEHDLTGGEIYESITFANRGKGAAAKVSSALAQAGIPGIRYLDGGSRAAGDGSRNYVIFDENLVRILEENGQARPTPLASPAQPPRLPNLAPSQAVPLKPEFGGAFPGYTPYKAGDMQAWAAEQAQRLGADGVAAAVDAGQFGPVEKPFVLAAALMTAERRVRAAKTQVERDVAQSKVNLLRERLNPQNSVAGQALAAQRDALAPMRDRVPSLAVDEAVEKAQKQTIDAAVPVQPTVDGLDGLATQASTEATETLAGALGADEMDTDTDSTPQEQAAGDAIQAELQRLRQEVTAGRNLMSSTTAIWQRVLETFKNAGARKGALVKGLKDRVDAIRAARANTTAANKLKALPSPAQGITAPALPATAVEDGFMALVETGLDIDAWKAAMTKTLGPQYAAQLDTLYGQSLRQFEQELKVVDAASQKAATTKRQTKKTPQQRKARAQTEEQKARKVADGILTKIAETHSDPPIWKRPTAENPIRKLYREHVNAMAELALKGDRGAPGWQAAQANEQATFAQGLQALKVPAGLANTLAQAANLEINARAENTRAEQALKLREELERLLKDSPALQRMINQLRNTITGGLNWKQIFTSTATAQRQWELDTYAQIRQHPKLQSLTADQARQMTRALSGAWQAQRRKIWKRELDKTLIAAGMAKPKHRAKIEASAPRLLALINLGALDAATFRDAVAKEFGLRSIHDAEVQKVKALAEDLQNTPEGVPYRRKAQAFIEGLEDLTKIPAVQLLESYWTAAVLSGLRTQFDIFLGFANAIENTAGSVITALRTGQRQVIADAIFSTFARFPSAMAEGYQVLKTGKRGLTASYDQDIKGNLENGYITMGASARALIAKGALGKLPGYPMLMLARLMSASSHVTTSMAYEGAKAMALARNAELYQRSLKITAKDRENARQQARQVLTGGAMPANSEERAAEKAYARELLDQQFSTTEFLAQANEIAMEAALEGEVQQRSLGAMIVGLARYINGIPQRAIDDLEKDGTPRRQDKVLLAALRLAAPLARVVTGTKFIRTAGHAANRSLSYLPGIGLVRMAEKGMDGAKMDILLAQQIIGLSIGLAIYMLLPGPDDEDPPWGIEGGWKNLTPQQKSQLFSQGKQPFSLWWKDGKGKLRTVNYMNWGVNNVLGMVGTMQDQRRYVGKTDAMGIAWNGILTGLWQWQDRVSLQQLQILTGSDTAFGSKDVTTTFAERLNKFGATTVGGLVPRLAKDLDAVADPTLRRSDEWWQLWAREVPMVRQQSSGARIDILGNEIKIDRGPLSRITQSMLTPREYQIVGQLNARDVWLPDPSSSKPTIRLMDGTRRDLTPLERDRYQRKAGELAKDYLLSQGERLLGLKPEDAQDLIRRHAELWRKQAINHAVRR